MAFAAAVAPLLQVQQGVSLLSIAMTRITLNAGDSSPEGQDDCFECSRRPAAKGFPICTIRNTPEKPIHCIVWAKDLLFERLFGPVEAANDLDEAPAEDAENTDAAAMADAGARTQRRFLLTPGKISNFIASIPSSPCIDIMFSICVPQAASRPVSRNSR